MTLPIDSSDRWPNDGETLTDKIRRGLTSEERDQLRSMLHLEVVREFIPPGVRLVEEDSNALETPKTRSTSAEENTK